MNSDSEQRLVITILREASGEDVLQALLDANFRVTRIASTGGFMRRGNSTLLIGVEKDQVAEIKVATNFDDTKLRTFRAVWIVDEMLEAFIRDDGLDLPRPGVLAARGQPVDADGGPQGRARAKTRSMTVRE